ncbi:Lipopolysaccharide-modifying protein [Penicillium malachiteum]|uniref:Lipopolysaccharide-modifying protein n=1 Tax=Penicillium malachiteum TaxID=1324776 RepID=UPI0025492267|nr:Lipopolysaccharide-modifying protein [Penicillium malachiteum]KAJ5731264.1 Lipopolysaccharide-modifying protein [Penicillium malachiteum]
MEYSTTQPTGQTKAMTNWKDEVKWDLDDMISLRQALQHWVAMGVTASIIGEYLVGILFNRDYHLDNRITWMARANFPFVTIGLDILQFLQICGEAGSPFWIPGQVILGDVLACPNGPATYSGPAYEMVTVHAGGFDGSASITEASKVPSNSTAADEIVTPPTVGAEEPEPVFLTAAVYVPPKEDTPREAVAPNDSEPIFLTSAVYVPPKEDKPLTPVPAPKPVRPFEKPTFLAESDAHYRTKELPFRTEAGIKAYVEELNNPKPTIAERRALKRQQAAMWRVSPEDTV